MSSLKPSTADCIEKLLNYLGLERVHVAACMSGDWGELASQRRERLRSLIVVAPHLNKGVPDGLEAFGSPALIISGDQGAPGQRARDLADRFRQATHHELRGYSSPIWADTIADHTEEVTDAIGNFLEHVEHQDNLPAASPPEGEGEIAGISYRVQGSGPPLLLLPLSLAPSQWDPLIALLANRHCTILLGGARLGAIALLEARANSGYGRLIAQVSDQADLAPGERVLEVGCGSGALARNLARRTDGKIPIVATDLNPYLLSEARELAVSEGLGEFIDFEEANAEALPFPDAKFDACFSCTVMEEGEADRMIAELARVTKPNGRVITVTRATDVDWWVNVSIASEERRKINSLGPSTGAGVGEAGCADASLYHRLLSAGLTPQIIGPQFAIYRDDERLADVLERLAAPLAEREAGQFRIAVNRAKDEGTLFVGEPFHCAISHKPSNR